MSVLPKVAHEIARAIELGMQCAHCDEPFTRANGRPASCGFCFRRLDKAERDATPLSEHPEATGEYFANQARKRRAKNNG
jgi:hypothetical protein